MGLLETHIVIGLLVQCWTVIVIQQMERECVCVCYFTHEDVKPSESAVGFYLRHTPLPSGAVQAAGTMSQRSAGLQAGSLR